MAQPNLTPKVAVVVAAVAVAAVADVAGLADLAATIQMSQQATAPTATIFLIVFLLLNFFCMAFLVETMGHLFFPVFPPIMCIFFK